MATILITGGTGLIGLRLAEMLKKQGHRLYLLSRNNKSVKNWPFSIRLTKKYSYKQSNQIFESTASSL